MCKRFLILLIVVVLLFLSGCSRQEQDRVINVAISQDIPSFDVMKSNNKALRDVLVGHVYERLFVLDEAGGVRPLLASSYSFSEDNHKLVIELRNDVLFHDGTRMDAEDAVASLNRWIESYGDAERMTASSHFQVSGDNSISIESTNSLLFLPYLLASSPLSAVIMPQEIIAESTDFINQVIGTGPYRLSSYVPGYEIRLERADIYNREAEAYADALVYRIVPDSTARKIGLERGEYDFITEVMSQDIPSFEKNDDIYLLGGDETGSIALVYNKKSLDKEMRDIIDNALSLDDLMKSCYGDYGYSLHEDYMEKGSLFSRPEMKRDRSPIQKGDGKIIRILSSNVSNLDKIAYTLSTQLEAVGFDTDVVIVDWAGFLEKRQDPSSFDIMISAFSSVPLPMMKLYLSSSYPGWYESDRNEYYQNRLINASSLEEAVMIWQEAQRFYLEDLPVTVCGHYETICASSTSLENILYKDGAHFENAKKKEW